MKKEGSVPYTFIAIPIVYTLYAMSRFAIAGDSSPSIRGTSPEGLCPRYGA